MLNHASRTEMKEIKGLEGRLYGLEQLMVETRKIVQEQSDLTQVCTLVQEQSDLTQVCTLVQEQSDLTQVCTFKCNILGHAAPNFSAKSSDKSRLYVNSVTMFADVQSCFLHLRELD